MGTPFWLQMLDGSASSSSPCKRTLTVRMFHVVLRSIYIPNLLNVFIMKGCCVLSNTFPSSVAICEWFVFLKLLELCDMILDFSKLSHSWGISDVVWLGDLLMCFWFWLANILLGFFFFTSSLSFHISFFALPVSSFRIQVIPASWKQF